MTVPVLTFLGAAGTVTGSRFLVDTERARVLVDAGLFQGLKPLRLRNWERFGVDPASIDAVVVTHSHIDHIGYLPALVRDGMTAPVHMTAGTAALARIVLPDAGHLQEEEADYANRKGFSKHHPALPLYTEQDAHVSLGSLVPGPFGVDTEVAPGVHMTLNPAGHILGSSMVTLRLEDTGDRTIVFSGDLGRHEHPILCPPSPIGRADVVVMESTYGNRFHDDADAVDRFGSAISRTVARGGTVLIPAFAVDRTEVVLFHLRRMVEAGSVPDVPIYVDSPMALSALAVYRRALAEPSADVATDVALAARRRDLFDGGRVTEIRDVEDSKALADLHGPMIIVSASGMATGGRVVHHLRRLLPNHNNTVLLVGYQAAGTRGRLLADGAGELKMLGRHVRVRAEVVDLGAFSVHADQRELLDWLGTADPPPEVVYLVHGEPRSAEALKDVLDERDTHQTVIASHGERVRLD
jgi:metallo-beta-lactamase family protein